MSFLMRHQPQVLFATLLFLVACGPPPGPSLKGAPVLIGPDGREYRVLSKGPYKAFYDKSGRVERLEFDSNGDGKTDQVALYDGAASPRRVELDSDFDGKTDRWETYDGSGKLVSVGTSRAHGDHPDVWTFPGPGGSTQRVELDTDGDGKVDRWQELAGGRLVREDLDTDHDGKPDRRIHYDARGHVVRMEPLR